MRSRLTILLALLSPGVAYAQEPPIREIVFEGNNTTRPETMLREMVLRPGDAADAALIERSRQGVQDLGLFREVKAREEQVDDGVRLVIGVREKYYVLPSPRADYNSDGQYSYGLQLRWKNVWGLNHSLRSTIKYKNRQEEDRGTALMLTGGYHAPFVFDSPYAIDVSGSYSREPVLLGGGYDDLTATGRLIVARSFWTDNPATESWSAGAGLQWQGHESQGLGAPPPRGRALAMVLNGGYGRQHDNLYSELGQRFGVEAQRTAAGQASDYRYSSATGSYDGSWALGETAHQTFGVFAMAGTYNGGTINGEPPFELGGADTLRGYRHQVLRGTDFWFAGAEALRPIGKPWLRGMVFVEAGDVSGGPLAGGGPYADAGIGVRLRLTWFVNLEFSAGMAWPLRDSGDGRAPRAFAGGYR